MVILETILVSKWYGGVGVEEEQVDIRSFHFLNSRKLQKDGKILDDIISIWSIPVWQSTCSHDHWCPSKTHNQIIHTLKCFDHIHLNNVTIY